MTKKEHPFVQQALRFKVGDVVSTLDWDPDGKWQRFSRREIINDNPYEFKVLSEKMTWFDQEQVGTEG